MKKTTVNRRKSSHKSKNATRKLKRKLSLGFKVFLFVGSAALLTVGVAAAKDFVFQSDTFSVKTVEVFGNKRLSRDRVLELSGIQAGKNIFRLDLEDAVDNLVAEPWIATAAAKRRLPDIMEIEITERKAAAVLRKDGFFYVDENGVVFKRVEVEETPELPIISGPAADGEGLIDGLKVVKLASNEPTLNIAHISEIKLKRYGITIYPIGSLKMVRLKRDNIQEQWKMLVNIIEDARRAGAEPERIDMNYTGRAAVKLTIDPEASMRVAAGENEIDPN